ncbi:MAG TPA: aminotransferase class V-fold PLP-dependent enzyme, partial [Planctomycetota bacterium]
HLGIQGLARRVRGRVERAAGGKPPRILVGAAEHPSAAQAAIALRDEGFVLASIPVDAAGLIRAQALQPLLGPDVALVVVQWANNELGGVNPIADLVGLVRNLAPHAAFHVDAVQGAGKLPTPISALGADSLAVAAHKIGGVRGCAALLLHPDAADPVPQMSGGGHEAGLRSGTENVAGAAAFAVASRVRSERLRENPRRYVERQDALLAAMRGVAPDLVLLGPGSPAERLGSIVSVAFPGAPAETLLHALEVRGVQVGSGSACSSHGHSESSVLAATGLAPLLRSSVIRFSLDGSESATDFARVAAALEEGLKLAKAAAAASRVRL